MKHRKRRIARVITVWLLIIVVVACAVSAVLTYFALDGKSKQRAIDMIKNSVEDVGKDMELMADDAILQFVDQFIQGNYITSANIKDPAALSKELQEFYGKNAGEVNVVNNKGIIVVSSVPKYIGYDMHDGEQSAEFLCLLDGKTKEFVQELRENSFKTAVEMKYGAKTFPDGSGFLEAGLTKDEYYHELSKNAKYATMNRRIGGSGYLIVCGEDLTILNSYHDRDIGSPVTKTGINIDPKKEYDFYTEECDVYGDPSYININHVKGMYVIGVYPIKEAKGSLYTMMNATIALEITVFIILFIALILLLRRLIIGNILRVNASLSSIIGGNLDERVEVRDTYEFDSLSTDINATVDRLKEYIDEAAARIDADLEIAKAIQTSVLPNTFPAFPDWKQFELFASMDAAKEVGGDFYDFYMIGVDRLGFLIADVSGKSIPGAMFMMTSKAIIKSLSESGMPPADVFSVANEKLCEGNDAEMFLTAWLGYLDLDTGEVHVANAGHNPPVLIRDGKAEYVVLKPGLMLAGMEGMTYKEQTVQLQKGDILYLYTDGVTEAMDHDENLYGEDRLIELLSFGDNYPEPAGGNGIAGAVCELVSKDVEKFTNGAEQSDDITMLCVRYLG